jgi:hypothetical protein
MRFIIFFVFSFKNFLKKMEEETEDLFDQEDEFDSFLHLTPTTPNLTKENRLSEKINKVVSDFQAFSIEDPMLEVNNFINQKKELYKNETKNNLVSICKELNLTTSGKKEVLVERLIYYFRALKEWKEVPSNFSFPPLYQNIIPSGPRNMTSTKNSFEIFSTLFSPLLVNDLAEELTHIMLSNPIRKRDGEFEVKSHHLYGFLGLIIETGLNHCIDIKSYHDNNLFFNEFNFSQNKWAKLVGSLYHLSDEFFENAESTLISNFTHYFTPTKNITIDETLRKFKGWWRSKVYSPDKPARFGLKYYCLVDKNGYLIWFRLHRKPKKKEVTPIQESLPNEQIEENKTFTLCKEAIDHIMIANPGRTFHLFADNYYGSLTLAEYLLKHKMELTLAVRSNRKETSYLINSIKNSISNTTAGPFSCKLTLNNSLVIGVWQDKS